MEGVTSPQTSLVEMASIGAMSSVGENASIQERYRTLQATFNELQKKYGDLQRKYIDVMEKALDATPTWEARAVADDGKGKEVAQKNAGRATKANPVVGFRPVSDLKVPGEIMPLKQIPLFVRVTAVLFHHNVFAAPGWTAERMLGMHFAGENMTWCIDIVF